MRTLSDGLHRFVPTTAMRTSSNLSSRSSFRSVQERSKIPTILFRRRKVAKPHSMSAFGSFLFAIVLHYLTATVVGNSTQKRKRAQSEMSWLPSVTNLTGIVVFEIKMMMIIIIMIIINCAALRVGIGPDWYHHFIFGRPGFHHHTQYYRVLLWYSVCLHSVLWLQSCFWHLVMQHFLFLRRLYFGNSPILQCLAKVILICAASVLRCQTGTKSEVHEEAVLQCWVVL